MENYFNVEYDEDLASSIYFIYQDGDESVLNELLIQLCPLVRRVFRTVIGSSYSSNRGYMEANALDKVYTLVVDEIVPTYSQAFTRFLYKAIKNSMISDIRSLRSQVFEYWTVGTEPHNDENNKMHLHSYTEEKIFTEQVMSLTRDLAKEQVRFIHNERAACDYLIDSCLGFIETKPIVVKSKFSLSGRRYNYLLKYVEILIKSISSDIFENESV